MLEQEHQEGLSELERAGELAQDLPNAVQEEHEDGCLTTKLPVRVCRLATALLEWVARLDRHIYIHTHEHNTCTHTHRHKDKHSLLL